MPVMLATKTLVKLCNIEVIWRHLLVACGRIWSMEVRTESELSSDVKFHGHNCLQNYTYVDMSHKFFANPNSTVKNYTKVTPLRKYSLYGTTILITICLLKHTRFLWLAI